MQRSVCRFDDIPDDTGKAVEVGKRKIALFRRGEEVFALADTCPHYGGPLNEGKLLKNSDEVVCPWHRFRFSLRTGESGTNSEMRARTYPVENRDGEVFVEVG